MLRRSLLLAAALTAAGHVGLVFAQPSTDFPTKPVRLIVPFPPGGPADVLGRTIAQRLAEKWGQAVIVENKAGANTIIAAQELMRSAPDGYTLFMPLDSTFTMNPALYSKLPYDPIKDFTPISILATQSLVLTATDKTPFKAVADVVAAAKAKPDSVNFGSSTTSTHLAAELFQRQTGTRMTHIPYKGASEVLKGMLSADLDIAFDGIAANVPHIKSGKIRALATTGVRRSAALPDVPTLAEAGLNGYEVEMWNGLAAPAGTPPAIVAKIHRDVAEVVGRPDIRDQLRVYGFEMAGTSPREMAAAIRKESVRYQPLIKELGLKLD